MPLQQRARTTTIPKEQVRKLELEMAGSKNYSRWYAVYIKKWAVRIFIGSLLSLILMAVAEVILNHFVFITSELYNEAFEICKTISLTLLGFVFAEKVDDLISAN